MTAAIIVVVLSLALRGTGRTRAVIVALGPAFALAVGASRIYLGDHYPTDVLGSYLTVTAALLLIPVAADLPRIRRRAARLLRTPGIAPAPGAHPVRPGQARQSKSTPAQHAQAAGHSSPAGPTPAS